MIYLLCGLPVALLGQPGRYSRQTSETFQSLSVELPRADTDREAPVSPCWTGGGGQELSIIFRPALIHEANAHGKLHVLISPDSIATPISVRPRHVHKLH